MWSGQQQDDVSETESLVLHADRGAIFDRKRKTPKSPRVTLPESEDEEYDQEDENMTLQQAIYFKDSEPEYQGESSVKIIDQSSGESSIADIVIKDSHGELDRKVEKQLIAICETHDLFCPNCKSCITNRAILRKRKLRLYPEPSMILPPDAAEPDTPPDSFRCLSLFSCFIPTGRKAEAGDGSRQETTHDRPQLDIDILIEPIPFPNQQVEGDCVAIIKSIVYGGLPESITSLGVVSCAAASGASTRNIMALGIANLLTGLTVIAFSLQELRKEDEKDGNYEFLGRRKNFRLHAVVSILSLLLFGLVPPLFCVVFDDRNYELLSAFAASLFCILVLAVGKVWVQKPPKSYVKSVMFYVSIAVGISGISFGIGYLIGESLKLIDWSQLNQAGML